MSESRAGWAVKLSLLALVVAVFGSTLFGDFVYDDKFIVVENPTIKEPSQWFRFFLESSWSATGDVANNYRPLPLVSFGLNYLVGGLRPFDYHLLNLLIHGLNVLIVFSLGELLGLSRRSSWLAAAIFAVHPLQTEPVAAIVGRMDLMAGTGFLAALVCHIQARRRDASGDSYRIWFLSAAGLYGLSLLSKEHVILFPLVVGAFDLVREKRPEVRGNWIYLVYGLVAGGYLMLRSVVFQGQVVGEKIFFVSNPLAYVEWPRRVLSALQVSGLYFKNLLIPNELSPDYCYSQIMPLDSASGPEAWGIVGASAMFFLVIAYGLLKAPRTLVPLFMAGATFLPVSNLIFPIGTIMGDRLLYLPVAGVALVAGVGLDRLGASRERLSWSSGAVVVLVLAFSSWNQAKVWRNNFTLDSYAVLAAPSCTRAHSNLGYDFLDQDSTDSAEASFLRSLELYPTFMPAKAGLAQVAFRRGQWQRVIDTADSVIQGDPGHLGMLDLAAKSSLRIERPAEARRYWSQLLGRDPEHAATLSNLAILSWEEGRTEQALDLWNRAATQPESPAEIWFNLAQAYEGLGRRDEALEAYSRFIDAEVEDTSLVDRARGRVEALTNNF